MDAHLEVLAALLRESLHVVPQGLAEQLGLRVLGHLCLQVLLHFADGLSKKEQRHHSKSGQYTLMIPHVNIQLTAKKLNQGNINV